MSKTPAMGRGLAALIGDIEATNPKKQHSDNVLEADIVGSFGEIPIRDIDPNPENPRKNFSEESLHELADSIRATGIIQAITVRKKQGRYQIISGERRFRAAQMAGLKTVPAYILIATDTETLKMALTENIQRSDLNPIEVAITYKALMDGGNMTQEQLSKELGKSRSAVANQLRLLKLPAEVQLALQNETISIGHAKPLVSLEDNEARINILHQILKNGLSVRQVEELCQPSETSETSEIPKKTSKTAVSDKLEQRHEELSRKLNTLVKYKISKTGKGQIVIEFNSEEDFNRIVSMLN